MLFEFRVFSPLIWTVCHSFPLNFSVKENKTIKQFKTKRRRCENADADCNAQLRKCQRCPDSTAFNGKVKDAHVSSFSLQPFFYSIYIFIFIHLFTFHSFFFQLFYHSSDWVRAAHLRYITFPFHYSIPNSSPTQKNHHPKTQIKKKTQIIQLKLF